MTTDNNKELIAAKGLVVAVNQLVISNLLGEVESKRLSVTVQEVAAALVAIEKSGKQVDKLKERIIKKLGNETYKSVLKQGGDRNAFDKIWKTVRNTANEYYLTNKEEEQTMVKMDLQFFGSKIKEETEMLEQIQKFYDIAKQIEEIDAVGGDVYVGGAKVSWEGVKQFIYGLDDDELEFLAYSNHPAIPGEMEVYSVYLLEAEKAWDNELTIQNNYFNSKKHLSMNLQFFAKRGANKDKTSEGHTLALSHIETLEKQRESLISFLEGRKEDGLTSSIEEELSNVESSIKRWGSIHSKSLHAKVKEGAIKLGRSY